MNAEYLGMCERVYLSGVPTENRTGISTYSLPGQSITYDVSRDFPLLTSRYVPFKPIVAELLGFLQGADNAATFRKLGTKIWDANANQNKQWLTNPNRKGEDDLGRIYGVNWRGWQTPSGPIDQVSAVLSDLRSPMPSRRALWHAWNPAELDQMALPPCHLLYQFHAYGDQLALTVYIRSNDLILGHPFNAASAALLLHIFSYLTGRTPWSVTLHMGDAHVYSNHLEGLKEMLDHRYGGMAPQFVLPKVQGDPLTMSIDDYISQVTVDDFMKGLHNWYPLRINSKLEMAV